MKKIFIYLVTVCTVVAAALQMQSCKKEQAEDPMVQTLEIKALSPTRVVFNGNIVAKGKYKVADYGFIYNTTGNLDENMGTRVSLGADAPEGAFSKDVSNITVTANYSQTLYVRAYLSNEKGTVFGKVVTVSMPSYTTSAVTPQSGTVGDLVSITGQFYATPAEQVSVTFGNISAKVREANDTKIVVEVPAGVSATHNTQVPIQITIGTQRITASYYFTMLANVKDYSPKSGTVGTVVNFSGDNLPSYYYGGGNIRVLFGQTEAPISYSSSAGLQVTVPAGVTTEKLQVSVIVGTKAAVILGEFTVVPPAITSLSATSGLAGSYLTINGTNFPTSYSYGVNPVVMLGNTVLTPGSLSNTMISTMIPSTVAPGEYSVTLKVGPHTVTAPQKYTVTAPSITGFSPSSGAAGREVNLSGNFLSGNYYNVYFGSIQTSGTATSNSNVRTYVPGNIDPGKVKISIQVGNQTIQSKDDFTVTSPVIDSFTPLSGVAGTVVTINGSGFGAYPGVRFGSINANVISATDNVIKAMVPSNLNIGAMKISVVVNGQTVVSNANFTVTN